jgi:hypothetical protein
MLNSGALFRSCRRGSHHARASTTLNVYAHAIPGGNVQAARLISGIVRAQPWRPLPGELSLRHVRSSDWIAEEIGSAIGVSYQTIE